MLRPSSLYFRRLDRLRQLALAQYKNGYRIAHAYSPGSNLSTHATAASVLRTKQTMSDFPGLHSESLTDQVTATFGLLAAHDGCVAVLAKDVRWPNRSVPVAEVGYFDRNSLDFFERAVGERSGISAAVYVSLNPVHNDLLALAHRRLIAGTAAPKDEHVLRLRTLLVDVDVKTRIAGISSSDAEKSEAWQLALSTGELLRANGFAEPVIADSGNGYHLLYRIDLPTDDATLLHRVLRKLSEEMKSDRCKIDTSVFNPARFTKLHGTVVRKGDHIQDRPHRFSGLVHVPPDWSPTPRETLENFVGDESTAAPFQLLAPESLVGSENRMSLAERLAARSEPSIFGSRRPQYRPVRHLPDRTRIRSLSRSGVRNSSRRLEPALRSAVVRGRAPSESRPGIPGGGTPRVHAADAGSSFSGREP